MIYASVSSVIYIGVLSKIYSDFLRISNVAIKKIPASY